MTQILKRIPTETLSLAAGRMFFAVKMEAYGRTPKNPRLHTKRFDEVFEAVQKERRERKDGAA